MHRTQLIDTGAAGRTVWAMWIACPEPDCTLMTEVSESEYLSSTDGPVLHVRVRCPQQHAFFMPFESLNFGVDTGLAF